MKIRLYFILSDENLFHPQYLLGLLAKLDKKRYVVVGLTLALDTHKKGILHFILQQLELWDLLGFFFIAVNTILLTLLDKFGSGGHVSLRSVARLYKIKIIESYDVNSEKHLSYLEGLKPDIVISSQGHIFKKKLLMLPSIACINRHTALLPKYGGVLPVFWAMYYNEKEFGVSVHYMVERIDAGNILSQKVIPIHRQNSLFRNYMLAFDTSIDVTIEALENLQKHKAMHHYHPVERGYFSFPSHDKIKEFKKQCKTFSFADIYHYYQVFAKR